MLLMNVLLRGWMVSNATSIACAAKHSAPHRDNETRVRLGAAESDELQLARSTQHARS